MIRNIVNRLFNVNVVRFKNVNHCFMVLTSFGLRFIIDTALSHFNLNRFYFILLDVHFSSVVLFLMAFFY